MKNGSAQIAPNGPTATTNLNGSAQISPTEDVSKPKVGQSGPTGFIPEHDGPDDQEKEERRRVAQKVFGKQG